MMIEVVYKDYINHRTENFQTRGGLGGCSWAVTILSLSLPLFLSLCHSPPSYWLPYKAESALLHCIKLINESIDSSWERKEAKFRQRVKNRNTLSPNCLATIM